MSQHRLSARIILLLMSVLGGCGIPVPESSDVRQPVSLVSIRIAAEQAAVGKASQNSIGMVFVPIPAGTFMMGSVATEFGRYEGETQHQVTLTRPFELCVCEVTQEQFRRLTGRNPSREHDDQKPVDGVTWDEAVEYCRQLSELPTEKAAGYVYRLPTEAEWEYACRAGTTTMYSFGDDATELGRYGWYDGNSGTGPLAAGQKSPNPWGLCDMHGYLWEWCSDWYGDYSADPVTDPAGPAEGTYRVYRSGSWYQPPAAMRSAARSRGIPGGSDASLGFRVARNLVTGS